MRPLWLAVVASAVVAPAFAQYPPIQSTQLPPLQQQTQPFGAPPVLRAPGFPAPVPQAQVPQAQVPQAPVAPNPLVQAVPAPSVPTTPAVPAPTTVERPNVWVPAGVARLAALDKVNAQATELTIKVGQSAIFGSLTITVKACVIRPPDQPVDAAAYLTVTDSHPESSGFDGWMLENEPSVSMMQNPIYDLRVSGCT
jgi:hypothetical protein